MTSTELSWLHEPPMGPEPEPPVATRIQALPFRELSWQDFERLVLRLARREGSHVECSVYGTPGQAQDGIDILVAHPGQIARRVCYQCKKVAEFSPANVAAAVDKFLDGKWAQETAEFVLCLSTSLEGIQLQGELGRQRSRLFEKGIALTVWDGAAAGAICERLKTHPDLVDDFFGREWVASFNGTQAAASLGERLNGYELGSLRSRLLGLYSTLFLQHDPGLRPDGGQRFDYRDRYVIADVTERAQIDLISTERPATDTSAREETSEETHRIDASGPSRGASTTYETRKSMFEWLRDQRECVVLGEAGYGKSAMLRYLALSILQPDKLRFDTLDQSYFSRMPVWISFARFSAAIERQHDVSVDDFFRDWLHQYSYDDVYALFLRAAHNGQVLLLVDGLDEASSEHSGREALDRIITFRQACNASIVCTSRPRSYGTLAVPPSWTTATLTPLSDRKIEELATRWFTFLEPSSSASEHASDDAPMGHSRARAFLRVAKDSPKTLELARNPLLCQSLIQLFRFSHQLPEARVAAYKQIVELLLSKHPAARAQAGGSISSAGSLGLNATDLNEILIRIAWGMQSQPSRSLTREQCEQVCAAFLEDDLYGLGESAAKARRGAREVVDQLIAHYGVLVERAPDEFGLLHLSIQEYLAAESVARMPADDQLVWMSKIWTTQVWRESLIAWFGVLGQRGLKPLAGKASQRLAELGQAGEWLRMQSLELRTEIATSDLGLPVSEARRVIEQAATEVETSPFIDFRTTLARSIALGSLGISVRSECQSLLRRWLPGHSTHKRAGLLEAFADWKPSDPLRHTLLRAFQDEEVLCRRAAVDTFSSVFSDAEDTLAILKQLAMHHIQPEVRASALRGLGFRPEWANVEAESANANLGTADAELFLAVLRVRIREGLQDDNDLNRLWRLWATRAVDFWIQREPIELLCKGWSRHEGVRSALIEQMSDRAGLMDAELPLMYLARSYPGDDTVAEIAAKAIERLGWTLSLRESDVWEALYQGFRGNARISSSIRTVLQRYKEKHERIFWDPQMSSAMAVLGDEDARQELLVAYETADLRGRYWISTALLKGWSNDDLVREKLKEWTAGDISMAAPLGGLAEKLIPDLDRRRGWLRKLARETASTREIGAIAALLRTTPDDETRRLAEQLLDEPKIWYYHRMTLQGLYARAFPQSPRSLEILERSLSEIDGPNPGAFAGSFHSVAGVSPRLLAAATPAHVGVRMAVASVLRERAIDYGEVAAITNSPFAEEDGAVRASCLVARARAARVDPKLAAGLIENLMSELSATGSYMDMRRRTALAGLLELGCYERIVSTFASEKNSQWMHHLFASYRSDPVSIGIVIEHWKSLRPLLLQHQLSAELPIAELVRAGYDGLIERDPFLQQALNSYFEVEPNDLIGSVYLDAFARRKPGSPLLKAVLLRLVLGNRRGDFACAAARCLAAQFASSQDIWPEFSQRLGTPQEASHHMAAGVLGHLALGWPDGDVATWIRALSPKDRTSFPVRDRLLFAILLKDVSGAKAAASEVLFEPLESWEYQTEDIQALRLWAESADSQSSLAQWIESDNPSLSITAVSLIAGCGRGIDKHADQLINRFNAQLLPSKGAPLDGLNGATGQHTSWAASVYSTLRSWPPVLNASASID